MVKLPDQRAMRSSGVGSARLSLHNVSSFETSGPSLGLSGPDGSSGPEFPGSVGALGYSARRSLRPSVGGSALAVPPPWTGTAQARARRSSSIEQQYLQDSGPGSGEMHSIGEEVSLWCLCACVPPCQTQDRTAFGRTLFFAVRLCLAQPLATLPSTCLTLLRRHSTGFWY